MLCTIINIPHFASLTEPYIKEEWRFPWSRDDMKCDQFGLLDAWWWSILFFSLFPSRIGWRRAWNEWVWWRSRVCLVSHCSWWVGGWFVSFLYNLDPTLSFFVIPIWLRLGCPIWNLFEVRSSSSMSITLIKYFITKWPYGNQLVIFSNPSYVTPHTQPSLLEYFHNQANQDNISFKLLINVVLSWKKNTFDSVLEVGWTKHVWDDESSNSLSKFLPDHRRT